jgi:3-oxoadipate enol-lactonase
MMITSGFAQVNGARLYFEIQGSGPTVVLLGNDSTNAEMANKQFDTLAESYQVIRYDMRGSGKSSAIGELSFSPSQDLLELLDHLSIRMATLAELTPDTTVASKFASTFPERISAIVPIESLLHPTIGSDPSPR